MRIVFGLNSQRHVRFEVQEVVGALSPAARYQLAARNDAPRRETDLLPEYEISSYPALRSRHRPCEFPYLMIVPNSPPSPQEDRMTDAHLDREAFDHVRREMPTARVIELESSHHIFIARQNMVM